MVGIKSLTSDFFCTCLPHDVCLFFSTTQNEPETQTGNSCVRVFCRLLCILRSADSRKSAILNPKTSFGLWLSGTRALLTTPIWSLSTGDIGKCPLGPFSWRILWATWWEGKDAFRRAAADGMAAAGYRLGFKGPFAPLKKQQLPLDPRFVRHEDTPTFTRTQQAL